MDENDMLTDALLEASRALVAVAARSMADLADRLTLAEFRALVVLHRTGPLPVTLLAERVDGHPDRGPAGPPRARRLREEPAGPAPHRRAPDPRGRLPGGGCDRASPRRHRRGRATAAQ